MNRISEDKNVRKHDILMEDIVHYRHCYKCKKSGFTLAEMMVVMLILSIVLAAMAPVMTTRNKTDYSSPWRYASNGSDAYFAGNSNSNQVAMIGQHEVGTGENNARLILRTSSGSGWSHLMFKTGDTIVGRLYLDESNLYLSNVTNPAGSESTSVGVGALTQNTGENNTAIGNEALHNNTSGIMNTAIGSFSLRDTSTGSNNIGVGTFSLTENTTGSGNVAIGTNALQHNTTGTDNIAVGTNACSEDLTNPFAKTISIGYQSLAVNNGSIAIGSSMTASESAVGTSGYAPTYTGAYAKGVSSIAIGNGSKTSDYEAVAIGSSANSTARAVAVGRNSTASYFYATALGESSLASGYYSTALGPSSKSTGEGSIALGSHSNALEDYAMSFGFSSEASAENAISIGRGPTSSAQSAIAIGESANATGFDSIAIGKNTEASGISSIAIGTDYSAITGSAETAEASGDASIAIGAGAKAVNTHTIAIGNKACQFAKGSSKVCIGYNSGPKSGSDWASAGDNTERIFIGSQSNFDGGTAVLEVHNTPEAEGTLSDYGNINKTAVVVHGALVVTGPIYNLAKNKGTGNTKKMWGMLEFDGTALHQGSQRDFNNNANHYEDYTNDDVVKSYDSFKGAWSDRRLKYVGKESTAGLDKIRQLKVFNYTFKKDKKKTPHVGVIAQDLQKVFPDAVKKGVDGFLTIRMEDMFYAVINAIKELDSRVTKLEKENQELEARIKRLEAKVK